MQYQQVSSWAQADNQIGNCSSRAKLPPTTARCGTTCGIQSLKRLYTDSCNVVHKDVESASPLKYLQYQYHPYPNKPYAGFKDPNQIFSDGYVGACTVDAESFLKFDGSNIMTNPNVHQELPMTPVQLPMIRGCRDIDDESDVKIPHFEANFKSCNADNEDSYIPYTFQYFNQLCYDPQDVKYIDEVQNFHRFDRNYMNRAGTETRHMRQYRQRSCAGNPNINSMVAPRLDSVPYQSLQ